MATFLSSPNVWRGMLGLEKPPVRFVIIGCGGGSQYIADLRVPQIEGGIVPVLPPPTPGSDDPGVVQMRSLHLIGKRDRVRPDSQRILGFYAADLATVLEPDIRHEIPYTLRQDQAIHDGLAAFFQSVNMSGGGTVPVST